MEIRAKLKQSQALVRLVVALETAAVLARAAQMAIRLELLKKLLQRRAARWPKRAANQLTLINQRSVNNITLSFFFNNFLETTSLMCLLFRLGVMQKEWEID
jgi:hypothetical protein